VQGFNLLGFDALDTNVDTTALQGGFIMNLGDYDAGWNVDVSLAHPNQPVGLVIRLRPAWLDRFDTQAGGLLTLSRYGTLSPTCCPEFTVYHC
jgi:hypothetical protein